MPSTRIVPDQVWAQLDPRAGRLSRRERRAGLALIVVVLIALGLTVAARSTDVLDPHVEGSTLSGRSSSGTHRLVLRARVRNVSAVDVHVTAIFAPGGTYRATATPSSFVLDGHASRVVRLVVRVRDCSAVPRHSVVPFTVVTDHWWGHNSRALFPPGDPGFVPYLDYRSCHGG